MQVFQLNKYRQSRLYEKLLAGIMVAAAIALLVLVYYAVRPLKLVDIKVPVATDKSSYYPGQRVSGIFFGEVFYEGKVEILREVYCKDYKRVIPTDSGDQVFKGVSRPLKLDGASRVVGNLPDDVPVGSNCVIQFANTYRVGTPFGDRQYTVVYYTQNFNIISRQKYESLQCENTGRTDCYIVNKAGEVVSSDVSYNDDVWYPPSEDATAVPAEPTYSAAAQPVPQPVTPVPPETPAEPVLPPAVCSVRLLGICVRL